MYLCLVPRHYPLYPRKYTYISSRLFLAHFAPSLVHSAPFFVPSALLVPWHRTSFSSVQFLVPPPWAQSLSCIVILAPFLSFLAPSAWSLTSPPSSVQFLLLLCWFLGEFVSCFFLGDWRKCWSLFCWLIGEARGNFLLVAVLQGSALFLLVVGCCKRCWLLICSLRSLPSWTHAGFFL